MKLYIVVDTEGHIQAVFDDPVKAQDERLYLNGLEEDDLDYLPFDESKVEEAELNLSFTGSHR